MRFQTWLQAPQPEYQGSGVDDLSQATRGYSQNGRNLEVSPTTRAMRGNFSNQRRLLHLAKHVFLGFLFFLQEKKSHTNENLFGSTAPSLHRADFCFYRAKWSEKGLREPLRLASHSEGNLWRSSGIWCKVFQKDRTDFDPRVDTTIAGVPVCIQPPGILPLRQVW